MIWLGHDSPGVIIDVDDDFCTIKFDDGFDLIGGVHFSTLEKADKVAFLEELRKLLMRFDASITAYSYIDGRPQFRLGLDIKVGDNLICFDDTCVGKIELTPDSIMDYKKEGV